MGRRHTYTPRHKKAHTCPHTYGHTRADTRSSAHLSLSPFVMTRQLLVSGPGTWQVPTNAYGSIKYTNGSVIVPFPGPWMFWYLLPGSPGDNQKRTRRGSRNMPGDVRLLSVVRTGPRASFFSLISPHPSALSISTSRASLIFFSSHRILWGEGSDENNVLNRLSGDPVRPLHESPRSA